MHLRFVLLVLFLVGMFLLLRWFARLPPAAARRYLTRTAIVALIGVLVLLAATGRLHWLYVVAASVLAFAQRLLPLLRFFPAARSLFARYRRARAARGPAPGQQSSVEAAYLRMSLDHDTGAMSGEVLEGSFKGRALDELTLGQLLSLLVECRVHDEQSAALLEAYLDRAHGDAWREASTGRPEFGAADGKMTQEEAYAVLGLARGATEQEIRDAHRRLMQKLHPDRDGSNYLAAKINQAKDILLGPSQ